MATEVLIADGPERAKHRNPWGVLGLTLITFGIYAIFWWYYINRELRDLGRAKDVAGLGEDPGLSTAAYALGAFALYIPVVWTVVTTTRRVQRGQIAQGRLAFSGWLAVVVYVLTLGIGLGVFLQYQMNEIWKDEPVAPPPGTPGVGGDTDLDRLTKLNELRESGAISEEEYAAEKARVLPAQGGLEGSAASAVGTATVAAGYVAGSGLGDEVAEAFADYRRDEQKCQDERKDEDDQQEDSEAADADVDVDLDFD